MNRKILDGIDFPADLKKLNIPQMEQLCREIREFLMENVCQTGGHLASNLGMVELTVAMHRMLSSPEDKIVFDVGHQCYTHKILTGRKDGFSSLRKQGGLSGFPSPGESEHDAFLVGHGSTSVAAAVGLARAKKIRGEEGLVVAVVGDGAFTGGLVHEALNNAGELDNLVIVLNDNKMSISKNRGGMARYFSKLRTSPGYYKAKSDVKSVLRRAPLVGEGIARGIGVLKAAVRQGLYHTTYFDELGIRYVGPVDGHDLGALCDLFGTVGSMHRPLLLHIATIKGRGYSPAENNPGAFHGVPAFDKECLPDPDMADKDSFSTTFGLALRGEGAKNDRICGVVAAMTYGTGMQHFKKDFRHRFFDVGMAEGMAVTFAAGLARGGLLPVVCIYSTFLQRGYDQLIHDVMLQNLNVLFAIDRAGFVPGDGETHQGLYDAAYLSQQRGMPVVSPANYAELRHWLPKLLNEHNTPRAIRYPRGKESETLAQKPPVLRDYARVHKARGAAKTAIVTYGAETEDALLAAALLAEKGVAADVYQMMLINPIPQGFVRELQKYTAVLFAEEGIQNGGIGEHLGLQLYAAGYGGEYTHLAAPETGVDHASVPQLKAACGLDAAGIAARLQKAPKGGGA